MCAVCTAGLAREFGLPFLSAVGQVFTWVALAAWAGMPWSLPPYSCSRAHHRSPCG